MVHGPAELPRVGVPLDLTAPLKEEMVARIVNDEVDEPAVVRHHRSDAGTVQPYFPQLQADSDH